MLTHIQIASAKPSAKPFNLSDSQGLFLTVRPNGSKLWRLSYRYLGRRLCAAC
ncbi:MAG: Arm DNA-binding domain-containing protein [Sphingobium sp.]|uniref:Arm DNA-binding domain-containing protein n=1 Tax=Sphingobium sp. TaxID=1912891 RepID=UPI003BB0DD96